MDKVLSDNWWIFWAKRVLYELETRDHWLTHWYDPPDKKVPCPLLPPYKWYNSCDHTFTGVPNPDTPCAHIWPDIDITKGCPCNNPSVGMDEVMRVLRLLAEKEIK